MAVDLTQHFLGKHMEKAVLGLAVLVLVLAVLHFVVLRQDQEGFRKDVAQSVERIKNRLQHPALETVLSPQQRAAMGIDQPQKTGEDFETRLTQLPPPLAAGKDMVEGLRIQQASTTEEKKPISPPERILPVEEVRMAVGRGVTGEAVASAVDKAEGGTPLFDIVWAGGVGRFDLTAQLEEYLKGNAEPQEIILTKVELQRRERKTDGTWSEWKAVPAAAPAEVLAKMPKTPADPRDKRTVGEWYLALKTEQADIRRMPFYALMASDAEGQTVDAVAGPIGGVEQPSMLPPEPTQPKPVDVAAPPAPAADSMPAKPSAASVPSWLEELRRPNEKPTTETAPSAEPQRTHVYATVWANDVSVEPGRTYQYQMRVAVFNPVYSKLEVKDEKARWALELTGDWSPPSQEVTIPPLVQFYFVGLFGDKVNLELHRWIHGQWVIVRSAPSQLGAPVVFTKTRQEFQVPGAKETVREDVDLSPPPNVLLVDVIRDFLYQPSGDNRPIRTNVLVFSDSQGRIAQRIEWEDRDRARIDRERR